MEIEQIQKNNYVHIQPAGSLEVCQVIGVHNQVTVASINLPFENLQFDPADIIPIPLTEFWLKELNFEEVTGNPAQGKAFVRNGVTVTLPTTPGEAMQVSQSGTTGAETISHVHQLQNYYTAQTGETVSLP